MKNYLFLDIHRYDTTFVEFQSLTWMMATTRQETSLSGKPIIKDYTIDINEKLYFLPGVSIPRVKLKDLYKDKKAKTVREVADATKVICGRKTLDTIADEQSATFFFIPTISTAMKKASISCGKWLS